MYELNHTEKMNNILAPWKQRYNADSKIWIYTSSRQFTDDECQAIAKQLQEFSQSWTSHGAKVIGEAALCEKRFILFIADEKVCGVSGCSIDKTMAVIRHIAHQYQVDLLNRFLISYQHEGALHTLSLQDFRALLATNNLAENTLVCNVTASSLQELEHWLIPYNESIFYQLASPTFHISM